ncbi:MAG TPA: amidase [Caulobacteraceae bacterium]|nr:amidase [Caulobacteraceae bacterium]
MTLAEGPEDGADLIHRRSLVRLGADLREGTLTARALLDHYLERIDRLDPEINAFVFLDPLAGIAADASDARLRAGQPLGPLDGIPVSIKDNLLVKDCPAVWGSPLYADYAPDHDETPVARLRAAGAVLFGKTNTPEFSLRGFTDNPVFGATRNPWNLDLTPGGSSGGAAAAVAAGLCPIALGTDGGGSIRRPAAHTGLFGLKPSLGRIERGDGFPPLMFDCEVVGPLSRGVRDGRLLFEALRAHKRTCPKLGPLKILAVERFGDAPVEPLLLERFRQVAADLEGLGHTVRFGRLPFEIGDAMLAWQALTSASLSWLAEQEPRFMEEASSEFVDQAKGGRNLSAADYVALTQTLFEFRTVVRRAFERTDVIMTPCAAAQPWPIDRPYPPVIDGQSVGPRGHAVYTAWVNACGHPAVALPGRPDAYGLPTGVQLVAAKDHDELLLDLAETYEGAHPWQDRWPPIAL